MRDKEDTTAIKMRPKRNIRQSIAGPSNANNKDINDKMGGKKRMKRTVYTTVLAPTYLDSGDIITGPAPSQQT